MRLSACRYAPAEDDDEWRNVCCHGGAAGGSARPPAMCASTADDDLDDISDGVPLLLLPVRGSRGRSACESEIGSVVVRVREA